MLFRKTIKYLVMRICKIIMISLVSVILSSNLLMAQPVRDILKGLYKIYDSSVFVKFDARFVSHTDTVFGQYHNQEIVGKYAFSGSRALFNVSGMDCMQNDSFFITVSEQEKMIILAPPRRVKNGTFLPMRNEIDSLFERFTDGYVISATTNDSVGIIRFEAQDSALQFSAFHIEYDTRYNWFRKIHFEYFEMVQADEEDIAGIEGSVLRKKYFDVYFENYRFDELDPGLFNENRYVLFDGKNYRPSDRYAHYSVFNSRTGYVYSNNDRSVEAD